MINLGDDGKIVIPKEASVIFDVKPGESLIVLCDKHQGIAVIIESNIKKIIVANQKQ